MIMIFFCVHPVWHHPEIVPYSAMHWTRQPQMNRSDISTDKPNLKPRRVFAAEARPLIPFPIPQ